VRKTRIAICLGIVLAIVLVLFVGEHAVRTLRTLTIVERERDTWQRPADILEPLHLGPGSTVVDVGSGAGYFSLKMAPRVAPDGQVLALDLRRESLAFLWTRALIGGHTTLHVIHNQVDDPNLPSGPVDAVLIANTFHELTAREAILTALFRAMRQGARLVVVDRGPRDSDQPGSVRTDHHEISSAAAEADINRQGFEVVARDDRFIDRPAEDDIWWLLVFRKP
jgi:ubiquinone/menaquinone biosynthesis C-methylase UbiE